MARLRPYADTIGVKTEKELLDCFLQELTPTAADYDYFLDASKVIDRASEVAAQSGLENLLSAVIAGDTERIHAVLSRNSNLLRTIPRLLGLRDEIVSVIDDSGELRTYDFRPAQVIDRRLVSNIQEFCEKTGLVNILERTDSVSSYLVGLEAGLDTHARKNRSGSQMEAVIEKALGALSMAKRGVTLSRQRTFGSLENSFVKGGESGFLGEKLNHRPVEIPEGLKNRRFDFVLMRMGSTPIDIEVNYFGGTGSKPQEIVDSYINRQRELARAGWAFVWITDGPGWLRQENQLWKAVREINYPLNLALIRRGCLTAVVEDIWSP